MVFALGSRFTLKCFDKRISIACHCLVIQLKVYLEVVWTGLFGNSLANVGKIPIKYKRRNH